MKVLATREMTYDLPQQNLSMDLAQFQMAPNSGFKMRNVQLESSGRAEQHQDALLFVFEGAWRWMPSAQM